MKSLNNDPIAHSELIELQEELLKETIVELREGWGKFTPEMKKYYREFKKETNYFSRNSDVDELIEKILKSDIVYSGDYHTLGQSQNAHLKLLSETIRRKEEVIIGMEMVYIEDQNHLDEYLKGDIDENDFLIKSKYDEKWGFNWENYKPILDLAKENNLKVIGLNYPAFQVPNPLFVRDKKASELISKISIENPEKLIFVIFGDMHITSSHLPRQVKLELEKKKVSRKDLIIYQNIDEVYFKLVKENLENNVDVVMLKRRVFSILNTTPFIKYQSRIHWRENIDYYHCKFYDIGIDKCTCGDTIVFEEEIQELLRSVTKYFNISKDNLPDFESYTYDSKILFDRIREAGIDMKTIKMKLKIHDSFYISDPPIICLGRPNTNHMTEQASIYLYYCNSLFDEDKLTPIDLYFARIIINALGFLGSKIINPKRKCSRLKDFELFNLKYKGKRLKGKLYKQKIVARNIFKHYELLLSILKSKKRNNRGFSNLANKDQMTAGLLSKCIGQILGENIFYSILQELISKEEIRKLFFNDFDIPGVSFMEYIDLENNVKSVNIPFQSKDERF